MGENILIDRTSITISAILKELRKVRLNQAYSLGLSGEVWEIAVDDNSPLIGSAFSELNLPQESRICALYRKGEIRLAPFVREHLEAGDVLIFLWRRRQSVGPKNLCIIIPLLNKHFFTILIK